MSVPGGRAVACQAPSANTTTTASVLKPRGRKYGQRQPIWLKRDKYFRHGEVLLLVARAEDPLERCLAVVRFALTVLADALRPGGPDPEDIPLTYLGLHHVTVRQMGGAARLERVAAAFASASGPVSAGPCNPCVHVHEVLSFDPNEGPEQVRIVPAAAGPPEVEAALRIDPRVTVKAKRLGRDVTIKVRLEGGGYVTVIPPGSIPSRSPEKRGQHECLRPASDAGTTVAAAEHERYTVVLPNLVLRGKLPYVAHPELKGDLIVESPGTGFMATLTFKEDGIVKGVLERLQLLPSPASQRRHRTGSGGSMGSHTVASTITTGTAVGAVAGGVATRWPFVYGVIGNFSGSLYDTIQVTCPELGLEGTLLSEQSTTAGLPPLTHLLDLSRPGSQQLPRLWAALHDALLYIDPKQVKGGKAAELVCSRLASGLHALFMEYGPTRAAGGGLSTGTAGRVTRLATAASRGGVGEAGEGTDGLGGTGAADSNSDSDFEAAARDSGDMADDARDAPPSYKAEHAAGRRLCWHLQYSLVLSAPAAPSNGRATAGDLIALGSQCLPVA